MLEEIPTSLVVERFSTPEEIRCVLGVREERDPTRTTVISMDKSLAVVNTRSSFIFDESADNMALSLLSGSYNDQPYLFASEARYLLFRLPWRRRKFIFEGFYNRNKITVLFDQSW